jgi:phage terminase small subunit
VPRVNLDGVLRLTHHPNIHMAKKTELTPKQAEFVRQYLVDLNGAEAARRAGYRGKYHDRIAYQLMQEPMIRDAIQEAMDKRSQRTEINADTILREVLKLATSDLRKLFDENGSLLPVDQWPDEAAISIQAVEVDEIWEWEDKKRVQVGETKKVKFWDKVKALELLGKHLKLFTEKHEHTADESLAKLLAKTWGDEK